MNGAPEDQEPLEPPDPQVMAELVTVSDTRLGRLAGDIVRELAEGKGGIAHLQALNLVANEAARRCLDKHPPA